MTVFEISGNSITGGSDENHNAQFTKRLQTFESAAIAIGKTLGMASVDRGFVSTTETSYGFRHASTSEEKFDSKGIEIEGSQLPSQLSEKLG